MSFWSYCDAHPVMAFLALIAAFHVVSFLIIALGRRRDVTVRLEGSGVEVVRGSSDGDRPS